MSEEADEVAGSARGKPIIAHFVLVKAVKYAERIENACHLDTEMIAVVFFRQIRHHLIVILAIGRSKRADWLVEYSQQLVFCNTAK